MGEVARSKTRRILTVILLISMLAITIPQFGYSLDPTSNTQNGSTGNSNPGTVAPNSQLASDPSAAPRPVNESAVGVANQQPVNLTSSLASGLRNITTYLKGGWKSSYITTTVYDLWDRRDWVINGYFTSNNASWRFYPKDVTTHINSMSWGYSSGGIGGRSGNVWGRIDKSSGGYYDGGDVFRWNQTVNVPRGSVISARLEFKYYIDMPDNWDNLDAEVYAWVGNNRVWGKAYVQHQGADKPLRSWHSVSVDVPVSYVSTPTILVSLGHRMLTTQGYGTGECSYCILYFDEVQLNVKAYAKPEQVKLKIQRDSAVADVTNIDWGKGTATLTGFTIGPWPIIKAYSFTFTSNVSLPARSECYANATIIASSRDSATTTFQNQGTNVTWTLKFATEFDQNNAPVANTYYSQYYFNVSSPSDWTYTTCTDPSGKNHNIPETNNFTLTVVGSTKILKVNVMSISSYSVNSSNYYVIHASSLNYVKKLWTQLKSGSQWTNSTNFYPQNSTIFAAYIAGASPVSSGIANLTVRGPPAYNTSPVVIYTRTGVQPVGGFANFTVLWNATHAAGNYSAQVDWVDNVLGEAGSLSCNFNISHKFKLTIVIPGQGDVILKGIIMINPPTTVSVLDYYTDEFVTATIKGRANWTSPGRWDDFKTYSVTNATYTNMTYIPSSLFVDHQYWLAVNASKMYYDPATANNTFWIGVATNINPSMKTVAIYYTESDTFKVKLSVSGISYTEDGGGGITGATIGIVAESSSNNSLVKWSVRFAADYSQQDSGIYNGWVYVGTKSSSAKAIPPTGTQYTVLFKLSKGTHWQTRFYTMYLAVSSVQCSLSIKSGDGQYVFWGATAAIKLNYTTTWTYGDYTLPPTPILNSTSGPSYAPPYVTTNCGGWSGNWSATHLALDPDGIYTLYVNTSTFNRPTDGGSGDGTITFPVRLSKTYYYDSSSNLVTVTLHIKRLTTSITGAVQQGGGAITLTNTTSVYSGDLKTIFVWYNDTHTGASMGVGGASVTYTSSGGNILGSGSLVPVAGVPGLYNLTLTGTLTDQLPGAYTLTITAQKGNYYVVRTLIVTLNILPIPSALQSAVPPASYYYLDRIVYLLWFNDTHNGIPITFAVFSVSTPPGFSVLVPSAVPGLPGLYNLTIPSGNAAGDYTINVTAAKTKYADGLASLHLTIRRLPTVFLSYITESDGSILVRPNATIPQGTALTIYLWFNDTRNGLPVTGVEQSITYSSLEFGNGWVTPVAGVPGLYRLTIPTTPHAGIFTVTFTANATGYEPQTIVFEVNVQSPGGFSLFTVMVVGFGGGGIVVVGVAAWLLLKRARIPFIIKKIDETLKLIGKGEHEQATPVPIKSREESIVGITQERIQAFSKRKPVAGAPEEAPAGKAAEEMAAAPAEVETALRKELKAVEPGKPEEEIEEVEMETLDEELGRLEKVDTGQEVPEGAKQARDVIEEYKKRKKK